MPISDPVDDDGSFSAVTVRHRVIFRDCTPTSYGAWAPFSLQILDTKDSYSVFIAFKVTDHRCDEPLCLQNVWAVGTIGLLTEYLLHYTHAL